jgi:hypothetical protein
MLSTACMQSCSALACITAYLDTTVIYARKMFYGKGGPVL